MMSSVYLTVYKQNLDVLSNYGNKFYRAETIAGTHKTACLSPQTRPARYGSALRAATQSVSIAKQFTWVEVMTNENFVIQAPAFSHSKKLYKNALNSKLTNNEKFEEPGETDYKEVGHFVPGD